MNDLKKVLLAGIGLTAMTVDKADSLVKELVEKGRLTVEEGKELEQDICTFCVICIFNPYIQRFSVITFYTRTVISAKF